MNNYREGSCRKKINSIKNKNRIFIKYMSVLGLRFRRKKRTNFFFANRNFIAVQIFTRPISSPPAGTLRFAQSPLRGLAIKATKLMMQLALMMELNSSLVLYFHYTYQKYSAVNHKSNVRIVRIMKGHAELEGAPQCFIICCAFDTNHNNLSC